MRFTLGSRSQMAWKSPAPHQPLYRTRKQTNSKKVSSLLRKPQFISPGLVGGSISLYIYQGSNLALTDGPFTVGMTYGAYDFYCYYSPSNYQYACSNYSSVFAPYGNDTFFVAMYDSAHHLLAITPGVPGTNFYGPAPATYTITSSGYPYPIGIQTYAVASTFAVDTPTSCVDPSFTPLAVETFIADGSGASLFGATLANPVTVTVTGGWQLYGELGGLLATPYTIYSDNDFWDLVAPASGTQGTVAISSSFNTLINGTAPSMNLIAVDRLAMSPSSSGLTVLGLVDSSPAAYSCGNLGMAAYNTGAAITGFTNPVAIGGDDFLAAAAVVQNVSGSPVVDVVDLDRGDFGFFPNGFANAVPVSQNPLPGSNPLEIAVSPFSVGTGMIYVLNADGSIQSMNSTTGAVNTVAASGTISGPQGIDVQYVSGDTLMLTSSNTENLFEIDNADTAPVLHTVSLSTGNPSFISGATSSAVAIDMVDVSGTALFGINDPSSLPQQNYVGSCEVSCFNIPSLYETALGNTAIPVGTIGFELVGGTTYALIANGSSLPGYDIFTDNWPQFSANFAAFSSPITRVISTYDGVWAGVAYGGSFVFNYQLGPTVYSPSLAGARAVIVR